MLKREASLDSHSELHSIISTYQHCCTQSKHLHFDMGESVPLNHNIQTLQDSARICQAMWQTSDTAPRLPFSAPAASLYQGQFSFTAPIWTHCFAISEFGPLYLGPSLE